MKYGLPWLAAAGRVGSIPESHESCRESPCVACRASARLTGDDWQVLDFYVVARDQVTNLNPFGEAQLIPRVEAWVALAELQGIQAFDRSRVIAQARFVHDADHKRMPTGSIHNKPDYDVAPEDLPDGC